MLKTKALMEVSVGSFGGPSQNVRADAVDACSFAGLDGRLPIRLCGTRASDGMYSGGYVTRVYHFDTLPFSIWTG